MSEIAIPEERLQVIGLLRSLEREGKATPTALVLTEEIDFDAYEALGRYIGALRDATAWWLGDWLFFGDAVYGEKMAQAVEATGRSKTTLQNYVWVATRVVRSRRRASLSWSHHREVASLEPQVQERLLKRADRERTSIEEFRALVREAKSLPEPPYTPSPPTANGIVRERVEAVVRDYCERVDYTKIRPEEIAASVVAELRATPGETCPSCGRDVPTTRGG